MTDFNYIKIPSQGGSPRAVASAVNLLLDGKFNATGSFTLAANTTTTTVTDFRSGKDSVILYSPTTANGSAEIGAGTIYVSTRNAESFVVTHANNAQTDRSFMYVVIG